MDMHPDTIKDVAGDKGLAGALAGTLRPQTGTGPAIMVRVMRSSEDRLLAEELVNRMYAWRGYGSDHRLPATEHSMTFLARTGNDVVGTLTLTVDSAEGLALDHTFSPELARFRSAPGARICELSKFAFDPAVQSRAILAAMFHTIFIHGSKFDCTDLFIEVNPRHRRFYQAMLGFQRIGGLKTNLSVGAPSQLMWAEVAAIRENIALADRLNDRNGRSLYALFPSVSENGIRGFPPTSSRPSVLI